jgi:nitrogen regulatory protein PII
VDFLPKIKIEVIICDEILRRAVEAITNLAKSGSLGWQDLRFSSGESASNRTGELGGQAL